MAVRRCRIRVTGHVQGVGFRFFAVREAQQLGLTGGVRNCGDGAVEAEAQGEGELVELLVSALRRGPSFGRVDEVLSADMERVKGEMGFVVRH